MKNQLVKIICLICLTAKLINAQPFDTRATIATNGLQALVYLKADSDVVFSNVNNVVAVNFAISLPALGSTNPNNAPDVISSVSNISGLGISMDPTVIINDRYVYTFALSGNTPSNIWPANSENLVASISFSAEASSQFPRLDNRFISTAQSYFYFEVSSIQRSDTEGNPFYNGIQGNYNPDESWVESATPLPIKLRSFTAQRSGERDAQLRWISESEVNASHFQIERSADGKSWESIGRTAAVGDTDTPQTYSYLDDQVPLSIGRSVEQTFYYRLRMVDHDGWEEFSEVRSVRFSNLKDVQVAVGPNPFLDEFTLEVSAVSLTVDQPMKLTIHTTHGQTISERYIYTSGKYPIGMEQFQPGVYILTLTDGQFSHSEKIIKVQ